LRRGNGDRQSQENVQGMVRERYTIVEGAKRELEIKQLEVRE